MNELFSKTAHTIMFIDRKSRNAPSLAAVGDKQGVLIISRGPQKLTTEQTREFAHHLLKLTEATP